MSLELDARQRAMLLEMGVRVWHAAPAGPGATPAGAPALARAAGADEKRASAAAMESPVRPVPPSVPAPAPASLSQVQAMDWSALAQAVASCQACALCSGRRSAVFGAAVEAPRQADWLIVGEPPEAAEEEAGLPFVGQPGQLLDNMLRAVGLSRRGASAATRAYLSNAVKCRPAIARIPDPQELAVCESYLRREVALLQPKVILALGRFAAQTLLQASLPAGPMPPLGKLRGQVFRYQGVPVIVSYHPVYLLRTQQDKARAWADWCQALALVRQNPAASA